MSRISHIEINVTDFYKSVRFYDAILLPLGWRRLVCRADHTTYTDGILKIVVCPADPEQAARGYHRKGIGLNHLALTAESKEQVDWFFETVLKPLNVSCLYGDGPVGEPNHYQIFFEDPDRIKIEVVYSPGYCEPDHWTNKLEDNFQPYEDESSR